MELALQESTPAPPPPGRTATPPIDDSAVETLLSLTRYVDLSDGAGVFEFPTQANRRGPAIVVCDQRICLIAGIPGQRHLGQLLAERDPDSASRVRKALDRARRERRLVGEVLLELGQTPVTTIRDCLLSQIADGLRWLACSEPTPTAPRWTSLQGHFDPRLTFATHEVVAAVMRGAARDHDSAASLYREYGGNCPMSALALRRDNGRLVPISYDGMDVETTDDLHRLGRMLAAVGQPPTLLAAEIVPRLICIGTSESFVIVANGRTHTAFFACLDPGLRGRLLSRAAQLMEKP